MTPAPLFSPGDIAIYTNDNGVCWGERKVIKIHDGSGFSSPEPRYFISPTDTPWFPVAERNLRAIELVLA